MNISALIIATVAVTTFLLGAAVGGIYFAPSIDLAVLIGAASTVGGSAIGASLTILGVYAVQRFSDDKRKKISKIELYEFSINVKLRSLDFEIAVQMAANGGIFGGISSNFE